MFDPMRNQLPSNKKFGLFFASIFFLLALYLVQSSSQALALLLLVASVFFLLAALVFDSILSPLNKLWMKFGLFLGMIVSPLVMGVIFFGLFMPISLLMRLFGRDELRLKLKPRDSHWKLREQDESDSHSFKNQF